MIDLRDSGLISNPQGFKPMGVQTGFALHHSVTEMAPDATEAAERAHVKAIDAFHASKGWGGFGYHFAVFPSGRAYYCGDGQRAHVKGRNHELVGCVAIGTFTDVLPEPAQVEGILEVRRNFPLLPVKGHNDWRQPQDSPTACPGRLMEIDWNPPPLEPPSKAKLLAVIRGALDILEQLP